MIRNSKINGWLAAILFCALIARAGAQGPAVPQSPAKLEPAIIPDINVVNDQCAEIDKAPAPTIDATLAKMRLACDWQIEHLWFYPSKDERGSRNDSDTDWVRGAFFTGVLANYHATGDYRYFLAAKDLSEKNKWLPGPRPRHADEQTIGQTYLEIYLLEGKKDPAQIKGIKAKYDAIMATEVPGRKDWWWCDALYMAPPTLVRLAVATGDKKYLDFMNRMYWDSTACLYDKKDHLYYRDDKYMPKPDGSQLLEANGKKMFWSRGNGWVFGGLCRVLDYMPADYPDRPKYEALFKEMAAAIVKTQRPEGLWHSSLYDPVAYPLGETSGSGFFTYGLAWGINHGLLDRATYLPYAEKAFHALMACVDEHGKLCYVQRIGESPKTITRDDNMEYGTGAFLLAGGEMLKIMAGQPSGRSTLTVLNPIDLARSETIEIPWKILLKKVPGLLPSRVRLSDAAGNPVLTQVIYDDDGPAALIFQADFIPNQSLQFDLTLSDTPIQRVPASKTYGRYVPERKDDFAWENDRIAHRIYGQALQLPGNPDFLISSGVDVWVKKVRTPIINKWYNPAFGSYHEDHGEGMDNYKVDNSRGCGGMGIWAGGKLYCSENYKTSKVLANGPIRTTFELTYAPWDAAGRRFAEVKRISLDAGSNLSLFASILESGQKGPVKIGLGLNQTNGQGRLLRDKKRGILSYWEDPDPKGNGSIATGIVANPAQVIDYTFTAIPKSTQNLMLLKIPATRPLVYYAGAGWSKSGDFADADAWEAYLAQFAQRLASPLKVSMK